MKNIIWVEKYRPFTIDDLVVDPLVKSKIQTFVDSKEIPHLLITGVPGIGKTSTIQCVARQLLGHHHEEGILELNASDERGIKMVREIVTNFCRKKIGFVEGDGTSHHKIIVLDEADNLTKKAQQQINNLMNQYGKTTRFAFTCNNSTDMITAIKSRCDVLRYRRLTQKQIQERLLHISEQERVPYTKAGLMEIAKVSNGDLRQAINNLQLIFDGYGEVLPEYVIEFCDKPDPEIISQIFEQALTGDLASAIQGLQTLEDKGYAISDIAFSMVNSLQDGEVKAPEEVRMELLKNLVKTQLAIGKGITTRLQLTGYIANIFLWNQEKSLKYSSS